MQLHTREDMTLKNISAGNSVNTPTQALANKFLTSCSLLTLAATTALISPSLHAGDRHNTCTRTTWAAYAACYNEIQDNYWISYGNCLNSFDAQFRKECRQTAHADWRSAMDLCRAQRGARDDVCAALGNTPYDPPIKPEEFLDVAGIIANPNPYYPLIPGTVRTYQAGAETIVVTVTEETKKILGVTTIVVRDTVTEDGELVEDTVDWYAQDIYGNVWYFGEIARNYEDGELNNLDGSWKAGVDGAKAGIIMPAAPQIGSSYRQEFFLGDAEDMADVLTVTGSATVPAASCNGNCVVTRDYTPISPGVDELKYYAPGIGFILEEKPATGERVELVEIRKP